MHLDSRGIPWAAVVMALVCARCAQSHDFWIQPEQFWAPSGVDIRYSLLVGHSPLRQRSPISPKRITRFEAIGSDGTKIDLRDTLRTDESLGDGNIRLSTCGVHVLVLETDDRAQSHLAAIRFNAYLAVEGLTPALKQRELAHRVDTNGSEKYSRRAKSILQVCDPGVGPRPIVTEPMGLTLEIVPEADPYARPTPPELPVRVIYEGRALAGATLKLTNLEHDESPLEIQLTDAAGRARFTMPTSGSWLLNVIWTKVLPSTEDTDFATIFSSLSFGFPTDKRPANH